jgi:glycosyltransferase involved in cell wall biosynthesis
MSYCCFENANIKNLIFIKADVNCIAMNIGFDAKRIFHNRTGLGNYGRTLVNCLCEQFPENKYFLYNPKKGIEYKIKHTNSTEIIPNSMLGKFFPSLWRSNLMSSDIQKRVDIFHGLTNELPIGLENKKVKKIVTIHDLIFEIYPEQYNSFDKYMYHQKFKYACQQADKIIATSQITKKDIIQYYKIKEEKIDVIYQTCDEKYKNKANLSLQNEVRTRYHLPQQYLLSVGSVVERKNLINTCNAFSQIQNSEIPLVIVGNGDQYKEAVKQFCEAKK